jgi:hypothetical protein
MVDTIQKFFARLSEVAEGLDDPTARELVETVRGQMNNSKLRLLVVGASGTGRAALTNLLVGQPELLPVSPIPKAPVPVYVGYGDNGTVEVTGKNGLKTATAPARLKTLLSSDSDAQRIDVKAGSSTLQYAEIQIENIGENRPASEWRAITAQADFVLLVLKATALLSAQERDFIRDVLHGQFGLERVAIVINQMDRVEPDERASVVERVRAFLGAFESQPVILEFSASQALKGNREDSGWDKLEDLIKNDLVEQSAVLKRAALHSAGVICLNQLQQQASQQHALLSTGGDDLQKLRERLKNRDEWIQKRAGRIEHRLDTFINSLIKEEFFRDIEGFSGALRKQLPDEIGAVKDVAATRKNLPIYLETLWRDFFARKMSGVRSKILTEVQSAEKTIVEDLKELAGDNRELQALLGDFDGSPDNLRTFLLPRRSGSQINTVATGVQLVGLVMLMFGSLPLAAAGLGGGFLLRRVFKGDVDKADKEALTNSALNSLEELEIQVKRQVETQFATITDDIKRNTRKIYEESVEKLRVTVAQHDTQTADLSGKREKLDKLLNDTLPALRHDLDHFAPAPGEFRHSC